MSLGHILQLIHAPSPAGAFETLVLMFVSETVGSNDFRKRAKQFQEKTQLQSKAKKRYAGPNTVGTLNKKLWKVG